MSLKNKTVFMPGGVAALASRLLSAQPEMGQISLSQLEPLSRISRNTTSLVMTDCSRRISLFPVIGVQSLNWMSWNIREIRINYGYS